MRKKSFSIADITPLALGQMRVNKSKSILSKPLSEEGHSYLPESQTTEKPVASKETFKIRKAHSHKSFSQKTITESKAKEETKCPQHLLDQLDSLEKCRKVFDRIIKKDKKFGEVLAKIKEVYENELKHVPKVKSEVRLKLPAEKYTKVAKVPLLAVKTDLTNQKLCLKRELEIGSGSDLETVYTSERGKVPELTLANINRSEFHEEFMANYPEFSESWRKLIRK
jgi:hypothetical protein